ncbi:hypothetical protein FV139_08375 [Parahaliea maris]|uniref:Ubiquinone biosynthesis protein Coq4 n=1 Tax=Parahaliea maris TaxID=2716870 RepID=A0A5C9A4K4_9GAMM|nr:hypothetical protein [Parahaliea maris]TXS95863.1 hypothetical protein FV139_08375 [Parahaliea maris]
MDNLQMSSAEDAYYKEGKVAVTGASSLLSSGSKWLNSPLLRDLVAQDFLRRNGEDVGVLQLVPEVMNEFHRLLDTREVEGIMGEERACNGDFSAWLERNEQTLLDLEAAVEYPEGTLGAVVYAFYRETGFEQVPAFRDLKPSSDFELYNRQRTLVHDVEHLVTGFGTDPAGELGMMYLYMQLNARYFSPELAGLLNFVHAYLSSSWMMRTSLYYPAVTTAFMESIASGLEMAQAIKRPLPLADWSCYFAWPLEDVRAALNITPVDGARWAWTENAWRG